MSYARCNFDGRPLSPGDQRLADRFAAWLGMTDAEKKRVARNDPEWQEFLGITRETLRRAGPVLREHSEGYWTEWYCEPPETGQRFRVRPGGDEWDQPTGPEPVRRIFEIEVVDDAAQSERRTIRAGSPGPGPEGRPAPARTAGSGPAQGTGRDRGAAGPAGAAR